MNKMTIVKAAYKALDILEADIFGITGRERTPISIVIGEPWKTKGKNLHMASNLDELYAYDLLMKLLACAPRLILDKLMNGSGRRLKDWYKND